MTTTPEMTPRNTQPLTPKFGQMLSPEAKGILVLDEFTLDPAAARKEQHGFRAAIASVALTLRRIIALRIVIALVAIANLPLFLLSSGWWIYAVSLTLVVGVHAAVSWLNRHEPRVRQRQMLELHLHRERSANYRKVRDAVKYMIDTPSRMNEHLYLELLAVKRVAVNVAHGTVALLDTSDDTAWKVRIVRELPVAA
ncbi:small-conductance mechanosensitive channel [Arthrobacter pascens]|nr:small-conductance mechanosensitive channel [Arthrobacter pascens]